MLANFFYPETKIAIINFLPQLEHLLSCIFLSANNKRGQKMRGKRRMWRYKKFMENIHQKIGRREDMRKEKMKKRIMAAMIVCTMCAETLPTVTYAGELGNGGTQIIENEDASAEMSGVVEDIESQASGSTEHYSMSVGDIKYLYTNASGKAVTDAVWTSSDMESVEILEQNSVSCRIQVKAYRSSTPVIIQCLYYYNELRNGYIYRRSDITDYYIDVQRPKDITVYLEANGGDISTESLSFQPGEAYGNLPVPSRYGYTFKGWYTESTGGTRVSKTTKSKTVDHTIYAHWDENVYSIVFDGNGNTGGSVTLYAVWKLETKDIAECEVTLESRSYIYDGTAKVPQVVVKDGETVLLENEDYTLSYSDNTKAGTASVTVTGIGSHSGQITKNFTIYKAAQDLEVSLDRSSIKIGESAMFTVHGKGALSFLSEDPSIADVDSEGKVTGISAGQTKITVQATGDDDHEEASCSITVNVTVDRTESGTALSTCEITLDISSHTYDGTAKTPEVSVKSGNTILKKDIDHRVGYSNNTNVGTASVIIKGLGSYSGTVTKTFVINKAKQKIKINILAAQVIVGKTVVIKASGYGTISYRSDDSSIAKVDGSGTVTGIAPGTTDITVRAEGGRNHQAGIKKVTVTVKDTAENLSSPSLKTVVNKNGGVFFRWGKVKDTEKYYIYRKIGTQNWKYIGNTTDTSYFDRQVSSGTAYVYTVAAVAGDMQSAYDRKGLDIVYLSVPSISSISSLSSGVSITWDTVKGASAYQIYRDNRWVKTVYPNDKSNYIDRTARKNGRKYTYKVRACKGDSQSVVSPAKITYYLRRPSALKLKRSSRQRFLLTWSRDRKATGYEVVYSTNRYFTSGVTRKTIYKNRITSMKSPRLSKGQTYYVKIRAYKKVFGIKYYSKWMQTRVRIAK